MASYHNERSGFTPAFSTAANNNDAIDRECPDRIVERHIVRKPFYNNLKLNFKIKNFYKTFYGLDFFSQNK